jgi:GNAT superfamily N-acetyltransferase
MIVTKTLAESIESCIKQTHIEVTREYSCGRVIEVNGGAACYSGYESFLSQVVGWGFSTKPKHIKSELQTIEQFYKSMPHPRVDIEVCPYVGNEIVTWLSERGYQIAELNNVSAMDLSTYHITDIVEDPFHIQEVADTELNVWAKKVAIGFGYPDAQKQFSHYAKARGIKVFAAYEEGEIIAGATIAIHGEVCDLGVTSTLPEYRGRGLQKQLLLARLNCAKRLGCGIAAVTTEPGTISDSNIQKLGFHCAYTRVKMSLRQL